MNLINVSIVSYLNSSPFLLGLQNSEIKNHINLSSDIPSDCAKKLISGNADIGLIPVAALLDLPNYELFSNYCIGANGAVNSVFIFSNTPIEQVKKIYLDFHSRTSNKLAEILCEEFWKIKPEFIEHKNLETNGLKIGEAFVQIGDRTFGKKNDFAFNYDLAFYWKELTGLPFVFAVWASTKKLDSLFIQLFNQALEYGLNKRPELISTLPKIKNFDADFYLNHNIQYDFSDSQKQALELFHSKIKLQLTNNF